MKCQHCGNFDFKPDFPCEPYKPITLESTLELAERYDHLAAENRKATKKLENILLDLALAKNRCCLMQLQEFMVIMLVMNLKSWLIIMTLKVLLVG